MFGVLCTLCGQLARELVGREDAGTKSPELEARYEGLPVSAQRCSTRERGKRSESKNRGGESVPWRQVDHAPNLGTDSPLGYIPMMAVPVLNPPKSILWVDDEGELL
ncbi:MAG TPA: hypothetical protein VK565_02105, partial [Gemmatimonadaceae bacterium]|nr:hypothetical protein [Gemmatimonadaceae bacterium]